MDRNKQQCMARLHHQLAAVLTMAHAAAMAEALLRQSGQTDCCFAEVTPPLTSNKEEAAKAPTLPGLLQERAV